MRTYVRVRIKMFETPYAKLFVYAGRETLFRLSKNVSLLYRFQQHKSRRFATFLYLLIR